MGSYHEAVLWEDVEVFTHIDGNVQIPRGTYTVTALQNARGEPHGARLVRSDMPGEPEIELTRLQYEPLKGVRFFERT